MKRIAILGIVGILLIGPFMAMPIDAQQAGNATSGDTQEYAGQIDRTTYVVDYNIEENGNATVTIENVNTKDVTIVLTESITQEGVTQLNRKTVTIPQGETRLRFQVRIQNGKGAFTVATGRGIVLVQQSIGSSGFTGDYDGEQLIILTAVGFVGGVGLVGIATYRRKNKQSNEIERVL